MLDVFDRPNALKADIKIFQASLTGTIAKSRVWQKPRGVRMVYMLCIGGGGGGGGSGVQPNFGGGGGGGAGMTWAFFAASVLPDRLYVSTGWGGTGNAGGAGNPGNATYVSLVPDDNGGSPIVSDLVCRGFAAGGGAVGISTGAAGGLAGNAVPITSAPLMGLGMWGSVAGQAGGTGSTSGSALGGNISFPTTGTRITAGGGGGGNAAGTGAGGGLTAIAGSFLSDSRPIPLATPGTAQTSAGTQLQKPFYMYGGCGAPGSIASAPEQGGRAWHGAGGGGGGPGTVSTVAGGDGGDGLVIIASW